MDLQTLETADVLNIYAVLVADFAATDDPIAPAGIRSTHLLESAVARQLTGSGGYLKYPDALSNAAALTYGVCNNHPFHNGNKRTALVAMLVHLDRNKLILSSTTQDELYQIMLALAAHRINVRQDKRKRDAPTPWPNTDDEVAGLAIWLKKRVKRLQRGEKQINFRELRRCLEKFEYTLTNAQHNSLDVCRIDTVRTGFLRRQKATRLKRIGAIGYRDEGTFVSMKDLKRVRRLCRLCEEDGVDSEAFYGEAEAIDGFVNKYRTVLRRLARK